MEGINLRGGYALMRATWLSWMQYRSFFFILAFGWMIPPLAALFVWLAAAESGSLAGFTRGSFVAYYLILILVNQITYAQSNWTLGDVIREGNLNFWLTRPIPGFWNVLAARNGHRRFWSVWGCCAAKNSAAASTTGSAAG